MRRTKIIVTLGPAVGTRSMMRKIIQEGCDVARLNVAHGTIDEHRKMMNMFREVSRELNKVTGVMLDIKGPEIRVAKSKYHFLKPNEEIIIGRGGDIEFNHEIVYDSIYESVKILIHDGEIELRVLRNRGDRWIARVVRGGVIASNMGVNLPGVRVPLPYVQERDVRFIANLHDVDFIAASFTRNAGDVCSLRKVINEHGVNAAIIAKIENQEGVDNIEDILEVSDGIMVARGDLGTEIPVENLPRVQKYLIEKARIMGKPAIIATQILESMVRKPYPTRAEVSDIANAILDGGDALMLSEETAIGKYPIEAVRVLARVAERADEMLVREHTFLDLKGTISERVSNAAVLLAEEISANAILALTRSGKTARLISRHRPNMPVIAVTKDSHVLRRMSILWGVQGLYMESDGNTNYTVKSAIEKAQIENLLKKGDVLVIVGGEPSSVIGTTNFVWAQIVAEIIARGTGFGEGIVRGLMGRNARKCDILIVEYMEDITIRGVKGLVIESQIYDPSKLRELAKSGIKIVAGTGGIELEDVVVTLDASRGLIWK